MWLGRDDVDARGAGLLAQGRCNHSRRLGRRLESLPSTPHHPGRILDTHSGSAWPQRANSALSPLSFARLTASSPSRGSPSAPFSRRSKATLLVRVRYSNPLPPVSPTTLDRALTGAANRRTDRADTPPLPSLRSPRGSCTSQPPRNATPPTTSSPRSRASASSRSSSTENSASR